MAGERGITLQPSTNHSVLAGTGLSVYAEGGAVTLVFLTVHPLRSVWTEPDYA